MRNIMEKSDTYFQLFDKKLSLESEIISRLQNWQVIALEKIKNLD